MPTASPAAPHVRYRVLAKCFVNDVLVDPFHTKHVFAAPGQEGKALKLDPETTLAAAPLLDQSVRQPDVQAAAPDGASTKPTKPTR